MKYGLPSLRCVSCVRAVAHAAFLFFPTRAVTESSEVDPRIGEMVRSLNLGREGEKIFTDANISFEVLQILTKDDLQVRSSPPCLVVFLRPSPKDGSGRPTGTGSASLRPVGSVQLYAASPGGSAKYERSFESSPFFLFL